MKKILPLATVLVAVVVMWYVFSPEGSLLQDAPGVMIFDKYPEAAAVSAVKELAPLRAEGEEIAPLVDATGGLLVNSAVAANIDADTADKSADTDLKEKQARNLQWKNMALGLAVALGLCSFLIWAYTRLSSGKH